MGWFGAVMSVGSYLSGSSSPEVNIDLSEITASLNNIDVDLQLIANNIKTANEGLARAIDDQTAVLRDQIFEDNYGEIQALVSRHTRNLLRAYRQRNQKYINRLTTAIKKSLRRKIESGREIGRDLFKLSNYWMENRSQKNTENWYKLYQDGIMYTLMYDLVYDILKEDDFLVEFDREEFAKAFLKILENQAKAEVTNWSNWSNWTNWTYRQRTRRCRNFYGELTQGECDSDGLVQYDTQCPAVTSKPINVMSLLSKLNNPNRCNTLRSCRKPCPIISPTELARVNSKFLSSLAQISQKLSPQTMCTRSGCCWDDHAIVQDIGYGTVTSPSCYLSDFNM